MFLVVGGREGAREGGREGAREGGGGVGHALTENHHVHAIIVLLEHIVVMFEQYRHR